MSDDPAESVSAVNKALAEGLADKYAFIPVQAGRKYGLAQQSTLNALNIYYLLKHLAGWLAGLLKYRPRIAHYAITSGWALEKGLVFLKVSGSLAQRHWAICTAAHSWTSGTRFRHGEEITRAANC